MERIILPYDPPHGGVPARHVGPIAPATQGADARRSMAPQVVAGHAQPKGPADYVRALRRRFWLMLLVAGAVMTAAAVLVLRMPAVYRASAQIEIAPPQFDSMLASLLADDSFQIDAVTADQYAANRLAELRNRQLVDEVLRSPRIGPPIRSEGDPALELIANLQTRQLPGGTRFDVQLEGLDPHRIATILNLWLEEYVHESSREVGDKIANSRDAAETNIKKIESELDDLDVKIAGAMDRSPVLGPDGENYLVRQWESIGMHRMQKANSIDQLEHQRWISKMMPGGGGALAVDPDQRKIAGLLDQRRLYELRMNQLSRIARNSGGDPAARHIKGMIDDIDGQIYELRAAAVRREGPGGDPADAAFREYRTVMADELRGLETKEQELLQTIQKMAPEHNQFLTQLDERDRLYDARARIKEKLDQFEVLSKTQTEPVKLVSPSAPPSTPVRPNRALYLVLAALLSIGLGVGLVVGLEHLDHSVRAPEQLATGLTLPLLGVIPRMRRTARLQRGGHLWTAAVPHSPEADAFRNLRAGLVGLTAPDGRSAVTLLITSAKAGEGKSTTALNLASTCARSGERTLLMDVDLRRPSLRAVFDDGDHDLGLVDVLRGEMPWQRTVIRTDVPNLDFLPIGDPDGIPVEILGALELKQLVAAVSGHYDRVILDGPAILGLADCRMLGRVVDAALLVVRAGANDLRPMTRARAMLEQSNAPLVGVVFNGLYEDVHNWSCVDSYLDHEGRPAALTAAS